VRYRDDQVYLNLDCGVDGAEQIDRKQNCQRAFSLYFANSQGEEVVINDEVMGMGI